MNCFNIRELQGILKRRFFTDLVNSNDHRELLDSTMIGLRYKTNGLNSIEPDMPLFFNLGTTNSNKTKQTHLNPYVNLLLEDKAGDTSFLGLIKSYHLYLNNLIDARVDELINSIKGLTSGSNNSLKLSLNLRLRNFTLSSFFEKLQTEILLLTNISLTNILQSVFSINLFNMDYSFSNKTSFESNVKTTNIEYSSEVTSSIEHVTENEVRYTEYTSMFRNLRFFNPLVSYDYKSGNYLGI